MSLGSLNVRLREALLATGLVVPAQWGATQSSFFVLCRMVPGREQAWFKVVQALLLRHSPWADAELFLARRYVKKDDAVVFGWHVGVVAKRKEAIETVVESMCNEMKGFVPSLTPDPEFEEAPKPNVVQMPTPAPKPVVRPGRVLAPGVHPKPMPRPPGIGTPRPAPENFKPTIRVVKREMDASSGMPIVIEEMPLPHTYRDLNVPTEKGKGATYLKGK